MAIPPEITDRSVAAAVLDSVNLPDIASYSARRAFAVAGASSSAITVPCRPFRL
jgi:hypothetical protein